MGWFVVALICPLSMGLMMLWMMRSTRHDRSSQEARERPESSDDARGHAPDVTDR